MHGAVFYFKKVRSQERGVRSEGGRFSIVNGGAGVKPLPTMIARSDMRGASETKPKDLVPLFLNGRACNAQFKNVFLKKRRSCVF